MSSFVSDSKPPPVPAPLTATQVWLGGATIIHPEPTALCGALVTAGPSTSHPGTVEPAEAPQAIIGTAEPAEAVITLHVGEESLRQELNKFRDLLRQAKGLGLFSALFFSACCFFSQANKKNKQTCR